MILTVTLNPAIDKLYVLDRLCPHEVMRVKEVSSTAGGKGLNVSRVAALSGERVAALGFVGGHVGAWFESLILTEGIEKHFTHVSSELRTCINVFDTETGRSTEFLEPGSPVSESEVQDFRAEFSRQLERADVVTISGSIPAGVSQEIYGDLIREAKEKGVPVILDASGETLRRSLSARPTVIKPNTDELRQLLGEEIHSREELIGVVKRLRRDGIETAAVSLGKDGVLVACGEGIFQGIPPKIHAVNTVGCGDSMVAGFAVSMARRLPAEEAIRFAVGVSAANAMTKETGFYRRQDLEEILGQVRVEHLEF